MPEIKNGLKTTEFWMATLTSVFGVATGLLPPWISAVLMGAYTISRGLAKGNIIRGTVGKELSKE